MSLGALAMAFLVMGQTPQATPGTRSRPTAPTVAPRATSSVRVGPKREGALKESLEQARSLVKKGQEGAALSLLQNMRRRHPKSVELHWLLGVVERQTGQIRNAEVTFTRATELDPKHAHAHADLAMTLERRGAYSEALLAINRATSLSPHDPGIRADRAIIRFKLGQVNEAIGDMERASRQLSEDPDLALNHTLMLLSRGKRDDFRQAVKIIARAVTHAPESHLIRLTEARAQLAAKQDKLAAAAYDRILDENPRQAWANWGRGLIAFRAGDHKAARMYGIVARDVVPDTFTRASFDRKRFYSTDAKKYLAWLDEHCAKDAVTTKDDVGAVAPSLARLTIAGGCRRAETKARLNTERVRIAECFGGHEGAVGVRVKIAKGVVTEVEKTSDGVNKGVDLCVLKVMREASYPEKGDCSIRVTWKRASSAARRSAGPDLSVPAAPISVPDRGR